MIIGQAFDFRPGDRPGSIDIVLRGNWHFAGDLVVSEPPKSLCGGALNKKLADRVVESIDAGAESHVAAVSKSQTSDDGDRASVVTKNASVESAAGKTATV